MIKAKVASIFQNGAMHLVKLTPSNIATGDIVLGFDSKTVQTETHPQTYHPEKENSPRKIAIPEGQHFVGLAVTVDGTEYAFKLGEEISLDIG